MEGGSRRVGREIWIVSVTCGGGALDLIEKWWADAFFTLLGIAQTTLEEDEEEDEE